MHAIVSGRVQGVSYRASTVAAATRIGVSGWVRNRDDGTVELEAEGTAERIAALLAWCETGPAFAHVSKVAVDELEPTGAETDFSIVR